MKRGWLRLASAPVAASIAALCGCASVIGNDSQAVRVTTHEASGDAVAGADCNLRNNAGSWQVKTPGIVNVRKSAQLLVVRCEMEEREPGITRVASSANAAIFGNILMGGVIGVAIDQSTGSGYDYPEHVRVIFGRNQSTRNGDAAPVPGQPPVQQSAAGAAPAAARATGKMTMDDLDELLPSK